MSDWYLIHTKIRQEQLALDNLERQGYTCFLPQMRAEKLRSGRLQTVLEPLFPRYLFIQLSTGLAAQSWAPIRSTLGVSRLVMFGQTPGRLSEALVNDIKAQSLHTDVQPHFVPGQSVHITSGPFAGLQAVYQMANGEERVMVLLHILSKQVPLSVSPAHLRKTD